MSDPQATRAPKTATMLAVTAAAVLSISTGPAAASDTQNMAPADLIDALKGGGHVIFIRHAQTEKDYADQIDAVMGDCSTQRVLSEAGWAEAKTIGAAFERLEIPVGDVVSSEYCRGWMTADLAFGRYTQNSDLNFEPAEEYSDEQIATMRDQMTPHLSRVPAEANTVLVGHDDPFEAATGIYPEPMGIVFVLRPKGEDGFEILGSIAPDAWGGLS